MGYPGIDLDEHGDEVQGFLFSSENLFDHWAKLDALEGESYKRVLTVVMLRGNRNVDAPCLHIDMSYSRLLLAVSCLSNCSISN